MIRETLDKGFCRVCNGVIVETVDVPATWPPLEPGDVRARQSQGLHCKVCGISYQFIARPLPGPLGGGQ